MPRLDNPNDPYATPPAPKERGGPMLRMAIVALLLAGAGAGYAYYSAQPSEGLVAPTEEAALEQPIRVADAGALTAPETASDATADAPSAAPAAATPAPARRAAPRATPEPAPEPTPAPVTAPAPAPMTTPAPIAPLPADPAPMPVTP